MVTTVLLFCLSSLAATSATEVDSSAASSATSQDKCIIMGHKFQKLCVSHLKEATLRLAKANGKSLEDVFSEEELQLLTTVTTGIGAADDNVSPSCPSTTATAVSASQAQDGRTEGTYRTSSESQHQEQPSPESPDDRRARLIAETATSYDCMEREFDAASEDFDPHEAAKVYHKCRLLVVKNVFSKEQMEIYRRLTEDFVVSLHHGKVNKDAKIRGPNAHGQQNEKFYEQRDPGKWEILHPDYFLRRGGRDFALSETLMGILQDPYILGDDATFGGSGALLSEPYTDPGHWHTDDTFIFGDDAHSTIGVAGHDIPSVAVNLATPLVDLPINSGLTEYCLGTSHLAGVDELNQVSKKWRTHPQVRDLYREHQSDFKQGCPPSALRVPSVKPGDVILWDYLIKHRAGANLSNMTRPLLFSTYGRGWYSDENFTPSGMGKEVNEEDWFLDQRSMADVEDPYGDCEPIEAKGDKDRDASEAKLCKPPTAKMINDDEGAVTDIISFFDPHFDKLSRLVKSNKEIVMTAKMNMQEWHYPITFYEMLSLPL